MSKPQTIVFRGVGRPYGQFSNFAPFPVTIDGQCWPTTEHYFQAMKFPHDPARQERIRARRNPLKAKRIAWERGARIRSDWNRVRDRVMLEALRAKFTQHAALREMLLATGSAWLIERSRRDPYWGDGGNGHGKNMLGKLLVQVRAELRGAE